MMRGVVIAVALVFCVGMSGSISAAGLSYSDNQVFSHGYFDLGQAGPLALIDYPCADIGDKMVFQTSYRQLYNIRELTDNRAAAAMTRGKFTFGLGLASFGKPDYFHQMGLASFAAYKWNYFRVGVSAVYSRISFGEKYGYLSASTGNLGVSYARGQYVGYVVARTINQPRYYPDDAPLPVEGEVGVSVKSREGMDSQGKVLFIRHQKPSAQLAQAYRLTEYAALNWALVLQPTRFGVGMTLEKGHFVFDYKFSHHPVLGATHTVAIAVVGK